MAQITAEYPISGDPIVRGDPLTIAVPITLDAGVTYAVPVGWTFRAYVRRFPDGDKLCEFAVTTGTVTHADLGTDVECLLLSLTGAQTALLHYGDGFDLEQTAPIGRTLWVVQSLNLTKDYSYTGISST